MTHGLEVKTRHRPVLDPGFLPAVLWNRAYQARVRATRGSVELGIALVRPDGTVFTHKARILPPTAANAALNRKYVERLVKFLLWQKGGSHDPGGRLRRRSRRCWPPATRRRASALSTATSSAAACSVSRSWSRRCAAELPPAARDLRSPSAATSTAAASASTSAAATASARR